MEIKKEAVEARKIICEEYPKNLLLSLETIWSIERAEDINFDIMCGINYALCFLNDRERQIIHLRFEKRLSFREIGEQMNITSNRVRQIQNHALRTLRNRNCGMFIANGIVGCMNMHDQIIEKHGYKAGYEDGYKQGLEDAKTGVERPTISVNLMSLPIDALGISPKTVEYLSAAGLNYLKDIVNLSEKQIKQIAGITPLRRSQIAVGLHKYGLKDTEWDICYYKTRKPKELKGELL